MCFSTNHNGLRTTDCDFVLPALSAPGADLALILVVALSEDSVVFATGTVEPLLHQVSAVGQRTFTRKVAAT